MADYEDYDGNDEEPNPRDLRQQLKAAKAEAKEAKERAERADRLERELVTVKAGLSLNERQTVALQAAHDGTWTPDAIRKTAEELGFITAPPPPPPPVDDPSLSAHDQIAAASAGTDAPPASRDAEIDAQILKATSEAELLAIYRNSGRPLAQQ